MNLKNSKKKEKEKMGMEKKERIKDDKNKRKE